MELISWKFDDEIYAPKDEWNWVEVTLTFDDGSKHWSILYTPERLKNNLSRPGIHPPGLFIPNMIIVRSYETNDVELTLRYLESEGDLLIATRPL